MTDQIIVRKEDFEAAIALLHGTIYMRPGRSDCRIRAFYKVQCGKSTVKVDLTCAGLYRDQHQHTYYARNNAWTHVRVQYGDFHLSGKGARSAYSIARHALCELIASAPDALDL